MKIYFKNITYKPSTGKNNRQNLLIQYFTAEFKEDSFHLGVDIDVNMVANPTMYLYNTDFPQIYDGLFLFYFFYNIQ